jgi:CrcB protein
VTAPARAPHRDLRLVGLVALGGAVGSVLRYLVSLALPATGAGWPWATFAVNVGGAFLLGWLLEALAMRGRESERLRRLRLFAGTGVLGGFTTYSTLALEVFERVGFVWALGIAYAAATLVLGTLAALLGVAVGRRA